MMIGNLDGIIAFLVFILMAGFSLLIFIVGLIVFLISKNKEWFLKTNLSTVIFLTSAAMGALLSFNFDGSHLAKTMDNLICWIILLFAFGLSMFVFIKKRRNRSPQVN